MAMEWLTYVQAGERLGISAEAVRQKAIRNAWARRPGNDGRTQVHVDVDEVLASIIPRQTPVGQPADSSPTSEQPPVDQVADARTFEALDGHIETLKAMVAQFEDHLAHERDRTDAERARADTERDRADRERGRADAERERADALAAELRASTDRTAAFEQDLAALKVMVEAAKRPVPWWRRLAG